MQHAGGDQAKKDWPPPAVLRSVMLDPSRDLLAALKVLLVYLGNPSS